MCLVEEMEAIECPATGVSSGFDFLDHTADVIISTWADCFLCCVKEMVTGFGEFVAPDMSSIASRHIQLSLSDVTPQQYLVRLMDEVLALYGEEYFVAKEVCEFELQSSVAITCNEAGQISGHLILAGGVFEQGVHTPGTEIKAITRHGVSVLQDGDLFKTSILVDI